MKPTGETVMALITAIANDFFAACETGKGWEACKAYCAPNATFAAQAEPLVGIKTLAECLPWGTSQCSGRCRDHWRRYSPIW
jgi:hypothetical protein